MSPEVWHRLEEAAQRLPGEGELLWIRAPGRVNLMGDHTDYNDGFCMPAAIDYEARIAVRPTTSGRVRVRTVTVGVESSSHEADAAALKDPAAESVLNPTKDVESVDVNLVDIAADGSDTPHEVEPAWGRYVAGVVRTLADRGVTCDGLEAVLDSTVPPGSGLSSSASLEVAVALGVLAAGGGSMPVHDIARACQEAEQLASGVPCGIMDQLASLAGRAGHVLLLDCRTLELEEVRLPDDLGVLVMHCGVPRKLADSAYGERRAACEAVADRLGVPALRDATLEQVADDPRAHHVVSENARVAELAEAFRAGERGRIGQLMAESHESLRADFEVSTRELDALVESLLQAGAIGARLTGAGFGGCVVAVVEAERLQGIAAEATIIYGEKTGHTARAFPCRLAAGAGPAVAGRATIA